MSKNFNWLEQSSDLSMDNLATSGWTEEEAVSAWGEAQPSEPTSFDGVKRKVKPLVGRKPKRRSKLSESDER